MNFILRNFEEFQAAGKMMISIILRYYHVHIENSGGGETRSRRKLERW